MESTSFSGKPSLLKKINKNIVLNIVRSKGPISRAKLSRITKISRPTISNIIDSLYKDKLIKKAGLGKSTKKGGTKPTLYKFNKEYGFIIGSQIRINEVITILTNYNAEINSKKILKFGSKRSLEQVINLMFKSFDYVIKESKIDIKDVKGIGIGLTGIVDYRKGVLKFISHFPQWGSDINFAKIVKDKYKVRTFIDNNCRMLVSAEKIFGLGKDYNNIVAIDTEGGVGSGIIIKGDIYRGNNFLAGEIGHNIIYPDGPECTCGKRGCAETLVSTEALMKNVANALKEDSSSYLYKKYNGNVKKIKLEDIFLAYIEGDALVEKVMNKIEYWFALLFGNIILNYNPEIIIMQGDYVDATQKFIDNIKKKLKKSILPNIDIETKLEMSKLGKYVGPIGSASMVLSQLFNFSNVWIDE
jgi:predicted NBD/HSP70 family sugar kinase